MTALQYAPFAIAAIAAAGSLAPDILRISRIQIFESLRRGGVVEGGRK